jgi:UDP-glucose 4-epimerase
VDPYGISKLESERLALAEGRAGGPEVTVLRFPLMYGPGVRANALRLLRLVDRGIPLPFGRVRNRRSFLYVGNAMAAVRAVLASPAAAGETFFVSDAVDLSTPDLVRLLAAALGRRPRLLPVPEGVFRLAGRAGDLVARVMPVPLTTPVIERLLGSLTVDPGRLRERTGFVPPFTPEQGWAVTAAWYRRQGGA